MPDDGKVIKMGSKKDTSDTKLVSEIKTMIALLACKIDEAHKRRIRVDFDIRQNGEGKFAVRMLEVTRLPELL
jgi:hypothetical protein